MIRTIKLLLLFFVYQLAVTGGVTGVFMLWNHSTEMPDPSSDFYVTFLLIIQVLFTVLLSIHLLVGKYVRLDRQQLKYYNVPQIWLFALILIAGMGLWNNYISEIVALPNTMEAFFEDMMRHPLGIFATVVMAPIMEELLFRGAIQGHLLRIWKKPIWAILVSAFLFGAVHGNPAQIPFAFIIGLGLGWMYYMTGSLVPCLFMHFVNNGSAVLLFWLTDNAETTLIGTCGFTIATVWAIVGIALTFFSVWGVKRFLKNTPKQWYEILDQNAL